MYLACHSDLTESDCMTDVNWKAKLNSSEQVEDGRKAFWAISHHGPQIRGGKCCGLCETPAAISNGFFYANLSETSFGRRLNCTKCSASHFWRDFGHRNMHRRDVRSSSEIDNSLVFRTPTSTQPGLQSAYIIYTSATGEYFANSGLGRLFWRILLTTCGVALLASLSLFIPDENSSHVMLAKRTCASSGPCSSEKKLERWRSSIYTMRMVRCDQFWVSYCMRSACDISGFRVFAMVISASVNSGSFVHYTMHIVSFLQAATGELWTYLESTRDSEELHVHEPQLWTTWQNLTAWDCNMQNWNSQ